MKLKMYQVDAFAERAFEGNPAAVVPLDTWLPDAVMQSIAEENNLAETAFFVPVDTGFSIRWFTPNKEVKLCGHATLASAYVLFNLLGYQQETLSFESLSGELRVSRQGELITLDFPAQVPEPCDTPDAMVVGLGKAPVACLQNEDYLAVFDRAEDVLNLTPDFVALSELDLRGVIVTAPSDEFDFIVRFFGPKYAIPEDSVTGSAYTQLAPYWAPRLDKQAFKAKQVSARGGKVFCELQGQRTLISGSAVLYLQGEIDVPVNGT